MDRGKLTAREAGGYTDNHQDTTSACNRNKQGQHVVWHGDIANESLSSIEADIASHFFQVFVRPTLLS